MLWSYGILHNLCYYLTVALYVLLLLGYCHCNIFCSLIILYYNAILILLYFGICGAPNSPLQHIHITFVTPITIFDYVGAPKPPILYQHICYICNFGYYHSNIFYGLIILYYNVILILLYFCNMWCIQSPIAPHTYYILWLQ